MSAMNPQVASPWQQFQQDWLNKQVLVLGLGRQGGGVGVANTMKQAGAEVCVTDQLTAEELAASVSQLDENITLHLGGHQASDITWADLIIKNPAVPQDHPLIQQALQAEKPVLSEVALAMQYLSEQMIGITGTRGKTTTTHLIHHLLQEGGLNSFLAGNLPGSPLLPVISQVQTGDWAVAELSSFQLESLANVSLSPHISVITTIYPDHLNRYATMEEYIAAKGNIFQYQQAGDVAIYQAERDWSKQVEQFVQPGVEKRSVDATVLHDCQRTLKTPLRGNHNWENIALARLAVAGLVDLEIISRGVESFTGVPYRLQPIGERDGITFINDTTSTTPVALEKALDAFAGESSIFLIGGATKNLPLSAELIEKVSQQPTGIIWLDGTGAKELRAQITAAGLPLPSEKTVTNISDAVQAAWDMAQTINARYIILSPGYSSFEWFNNEFERGDQFNALVQQRTG